MEARDWAALPRDIILDVFLRLGALEVMLGAELACTAWRRAAIEEPTLWRRVGTEDTVGELWRRARCSDIEMPMKLAAVEHAAGQCEAFEGECDDDDYLHELVKSLKLQNYDHRIMNQEMCWLRCSRSSLFLRNFIFISDMLSMTVRTFLDQFAELVLPHLKKLMLLYHSAFDFEWPGVEFREFRDDVPIIDGEIPKMHKLHSLHLEECELTAKGLKSILDSCPRLKTLEIFGYFDKGEMDKELWVKCARIKNLILPSTRKDQHLYPFGDYDSLYYDSQEEDYDSQEGDYDLQEEENSYY
ncbi:unnamed protein product [Urochloa decumbens]|uniref:F-box domain-containing protein n=1 Tax=Urochloa decumbens TaxID=240449 RepID=A0ABC9BDP6_9POAL